MSDVVEKQPTVDFLEGLRRNGIFFMFPQLAR
jgi:hypothetical protein